MRAAKHRDETGRLAALRRYDILDTPREKDFDQIVEFAARLCGTAISVINLIDADRQWFKAETGLGVRETPLDTSLCAHVILEDWFVEIPDTLADPRMADNPLCTAAGGLRFYAGALLRSVEGLPIGTLCVLDHQPRTLDPVQRDGLRVLADQVMAQLDLRAMIGNQATLRNEIDHRVKNSLQTVSAFVSIERTRVPNDDARQALTRVQQQIDTVALLHERLSDHDTRGEVALAAYLAQVTSLLDRATPHRIAVRGSFAARTTTAREAAILGTIVNELVANAVKHSFADGGGTIRLSTEDDADEGFILTCGDDGVPPPAPADPRESASDRRDGLGLAILNASARQLGGTIDRSANPEGFRTTLRCRLSRTA